MSVPHPAKTAGLAKAPARTAGMPHMGTAGRMEGSIFDMPRSTSAYAAARDFDYHNHTASYPFSRPTFARPTPTATFARPSSSFGRPPMTDSYASERFGNYTSGMPDFRRPYTSGRVSLNGFDDY